MKHKSKLLFFFFVFALLMQQAKAQPIAFIWLPAPVADSLQYRMDTNTYCGTAGVTVIRKSVVRYYKIFPGVWFAPKALVIWKHKRPSVFFIRKKRV